MAELERMQQAHTYLIQLANGIDPITGQEAYATDVINRVQISRCLFYAADVLRQVIDNGGISGKKAKQKKQPFALPPEARANFECTVQPVTISQIAQRLNALVDLEQTQRLKVTSLSTFLKRSELLYLHEKPDGKSQLLPTDSGRSLGLATETREGQNGSYTVVTYSRAAQQLILDNLDSIIAINAEPLHENQGKPWTPELDAQLRQLVISGADVKQLSEAFKRSRSAIRGRLEKLGISPAPAAPKAPEEKDLPF